MNQQPTSPATISTKITPPAAIQPSTTSSFRILFALLSTPGHPVSPPTISPKTNSSEASISAAINLVA